MRTRNQKLGVFNLCKTVEMLMTRSSAEFVSYCYNVQKTKVMEESYEWGVAVK